MPSPGGIDLAWFGRSFNLAEAKLAELAKRNDLVVVDKDHHTALPRAAVDATKAQVLQVLKRFHADSPQARGIEVPILRKQCAPHLPAPAFAGVLRMLGEEKKIELTGSIARIPAHISTANPVDDKMWLSVQPVLEKAGYGGLTLAELAAAAAIREPQLKDFLHRKAKTGEVVRVTDQRFYLRGTLAKFAAITDGVFRTVPGGKFSAAQVRDKTDIGRGRAIEILECFDRLGITQRVGDLRVMRKDYTAILGPATPP